MNEQSITQRCGGLTVAWMAFGVLLIGISLTNFLPKKFIWNASASLPVGLYKIRDRNPTHGDLVLAKLPEWAGLIADQRGYLPANVPALKRVVAISGDRVCRIDRVIYVEGTAVAWARSTDRYGRRLPVWSGCVALDESQVLLLADHSKSFDGRYFGVSKLADVLGVARPVWIRSE
ncbi:MAG: S26 family signal peptidase [Rhizobiaceae bacterium]